MAMQELKVSPSELKKKANVFASQAKKVKSTTNKIFEVAEQLKGDTWSGDANTNFKSRFKGLEDDTNRLVELINKFATQLNAVASEYEKTESSNIEVSNKLKTDVIS